MICIVLLGYLEAKNKFFYFVLNSNTKENMENAFHSFYSWRRKIPAGIKETRNNYYDQSFTMKHTISLSICHGKGYAIVLLPNWSQNDQNGN